MFSLIRYSYDKNGEYAVHTTLIDLLIGVTR